MNNAILKTRDQLIEVARLLFARMGIENTTMNDIAQASQKGRRTLYTYFRSKTDIYEAVLESEFAKLTEALKSVAQKDIPADEKLLLFIDVRLNIIRDAVLRNGTLKADFFRDIWRVESVRKKFDSLEIDCLLQILDEGVGAGIFQIDNTSAMASILHYAFKGLEVPYIRGTFKGYSPTDKSSRESLINLLYKGIKKQ